MAITTTCCLNLPSPPSTSLAPPNSSKPNQVSWYGGKVGSWRKQCVVGMACIIIGSEMMPLLGSECFAMAENLQVNVEETKKRAVRWSDKRACPPWQVNSLEIVVPEDLPRPSSHRRSESITLSKVTPSNPPVRLPIRTSNNCFSM